MSDKRPGGDLTELMEALAVGIVDADPDDLPALADLHTRCAALATALEFDRPEAATLAKTTADLIERIVLCEADDPVEAVGQVNQAITTLQALVSAPAPGSPDAPAPALEGVTEEPSVEEASEAEVQDDLISEKKQEAIEAIVSEPLVGEGADATLLAEFISEAREHLDNADTSLLDLETEPGHDDAINAVFRAFHTIKGVAGFLAMAPIQALAHEAENVLDRSRRGELVLEGVVMDTVFEAVDLLRQLVDGVETFVTEGEAPPTPADALRPLLRRLHAIMNLDAGSRLGDILVDAGLVPAEAVDAANKAAAESDGKTRLGEQLVKQGAASAKDVAGALRAQASAQSAAMHVAEAVKVDADRLDQLIDMIGELVIAEAMVSQLPEVAEQGSTNLSRNVHQLGKIVRELQQLGTSLRMVPLKATFQKMARLVRDVAKKAGKQVEFHMAGEDAEMDKSVVDAISDPLVHILRNAVDHGLEPDPDDREAAGKKRAGSVTLRAFYEGGSVFIEVADDGRGLNAEKILAKAVEKGVVPPGESLSESEIHNLIFEPGFSTAGQITDISGRGVGMDVVRRNIDRLRGQVDVRSKEGEGTTVTLRLPLTLAVIDGMVVRTADQRYIIPTLSIVQTVRPTAATRATVLGKGEMIDVQGQKIPLFRLARLFGIPHQPDLDTALAIIVEDGAQKVALLVDELLGQQQIVIKSLGEVLQGADGLSGGAIMADGRVGLIVDVAGVVRLAQSEVRGQGRNGWDGPDLAPAGPTSPAPAAPQSSLQPAF